MSCSVRHLHCCAVSGPWGFSTKIKQNIKQTRHLPASQDFEWSPAEPLLAAYTQEVGDRPANITVIRIPDRTNVRSKQLFNVSGEWPGGATACALEPL